MISNKYEVHEQQIVKLSADSAKTDAKMERCLKLLEDAMAKFTGSGPEHVSGKVRKKK